VYTEPAAEEAVRLAQEVVECVGEKLKPKA
jgi:HEPN domain-containing protein